MFTAKNTTDDANPKEGSINLIGAGTEITGDLLTKGDVRIDGCITGHISSKAKVVVGSGGQVDGDVTCQTAEISGLVNGNLSVSEILFLKTSARIKGNISASKMVVENGAVFTGHCHIGAGFTQPEPLNDRPAALPQSTRTSQPKEIHQ